MPYRIKSSHLVKVVVFILLEI